MKPLHLYQVFQLYYLLNVYHNIGPIISDELVISGNVSIIEFNVSEL